MQALEAIVVGRPTQPVVFVQRAEMPGCHEASERRMRMTAHLRHRLGYEQQHGDGAAQHSRRELCRGGNGRGHRVGREGVFDTPGEIVDRLGERRDGLQRAVLAPARDIRHRLAVHL